jgi:hypothetical protein
MATTAPKLDAALPEDFTEFLGQRLALEPSEAMQLIRHWLAGYQPSAESRARALQLREAEAAARVTEPRASDRLPSAVAA